MLFKDAEERCEDIRSIESISAINAERSLKLNRAELLFLLHDPKGNLLQREITTSATRDLQALHIIKIDPLILTTNEFLEFLTSDETNPLKEMLYNKITFHGPQDFWSHITAALAKGYSIALLEAETNPGRYPRRI